MTGYGINQARVAAMDTDNDIVKSDAAPIFKQVPITIHCRRSYRPTTEVSRAFRVWYLEEVKEKLNAATR
jgi:hypothetical protein